MAARLMITLTNNECDALMSMADTDLRDPREQLRYLLREEAGRRGLLLSEHQVKYEEDLDGKTTTADS